MGRKHTSCPENLKPLIENARLFPVDAVEGDIEAFELAFRRIVFQPFGYYWRHNQMITAQVALEDLEALTAPLVAELVREIKTSRVISTKYVSLAISLGIPPGEGGLSEVLWRKWERRCELRDLAKSLLWRIDPVTGKRLSLATGHILRLKQSRFLRLREDGTLSEPYPWTDVTATIIADKIPVGRLRICQECGHVFWAHRNTKWACSPLCSQKQARRKKEKIDGSL